MSSITNPTTSHVRYLGAATASLGSSAGLGYASSPFFSSGSTLLAALVGVPLASVSTGFCLVGGAMCCRYVNPDSREESVQTFDNRIEGCKQSIGRMIASVRSCCDYQEME